MTTRIGPPANTSIGPSPFTAQHGLVLKCAVGSALDVDDHVAQQAANNGWHIFALVGTTAQRPTASWVLKRDLRYIDTTLGLEIMFDGVQWRNPVTGALV